jgi:hypothetical protein
MSRFLHQLVFCSSRIGRCFLTEITVSPTSALITNIEPMPPGYHVPLAMMRPSDEMVAVFDGHPGVWSGYDGCPFCHETGVFYCTCGVISCMSARARVHTCPSCQKVCEPVPARHTLMSESGFVGAPRGLPGPRADSRGVLGTPIDVRRIAPPRAPEGPPRIGSGDAPRLLPPAPPPDVPGEWTRKLLGPGGDPPPADDADPAPDEDARRRLRDFLKRKP